MNFPSLEESALSSYSASLTKTNKSSEITDRFLDNLQHHATPTIEFLENVTDAMVLKSLAIVNELFDDEESSLESKIRGVTAVKGIADYVERKRVLKSRERGIDIHTDIEVNGEED